MSRIVALFCFLALAWAVSVPAMEGPTVELGKNLFESTSLGSNGKSCSTCHQDGKGLNKIGTYEDGQLKEIISSCIQNALKGKKFNPEAQELDALLAYLRSLQK